MGVSFASCSQPQKGVTHIITDEKNKPIIDQLLKGMTPEQPEVATPKVDVLKVAPSKTLEPTSPNILSEEKIFKALPFEESLWHKVISFIQEKVLDYVKDNGLQIDANGKETILSYNKTDQEKILDGFIGVESKYSQMGLEELGALEAEFKAKFGLDELQVEDLAISTPDVPEVKVDNPAVHPDAPTEIPIEEIAVDKARYPQIEEMIMKVQASCFAQNIRQNPGITMEDNLKLSAEQTIEKLQEAKYKTRINFDKEDSTFKINFDAKDKNQVIRQTEALSDTVGKLEGEPISNELKATIDGLSSTISDIKPDSVPLDQEKSLVKALA